MEDETTAEVQASMEHEAMRRTAPDLSEARRALVRQWGEALRFAREFHKPAFDRMRESMDFARGKQWPHMRKMADGSPSDPQARWDDASYYTANIVQRHVQQRVAALYARNPKCAVKPKARLMSQVWDGSPGQIAQAQQMVAAAMQGMVPPETALMAQEVLKDFEAAHTQRLHATRLARTLELALDHFAGEQAVNFKAQMKSAVRRALTCGVAYVKVGFQREMQMKPDLEARINDASTRLAVLERLSAELADGEVDENSAEAENLRLALKEMQAEVITREGLVYDFPPSPSILIDPRCKRLRGFVGADWVAQDYLMTPDEVMEVYGVDVRQSGYAAYTGGNYPAGEVSPIGSGREEEGGRATSPDSRKTGRCLVSEIYSRKDGLVYHFCEGYPDFLREPAAPDFFLERFWPWVPLVFNECEHHTELFPPSDVDLIRDMQIEFNRARQGLREHRKASRPKIGVGKGQLDDEDVEKLEEHPVDGVAVLELNALNEGAKIDDVLQPIRMPGIDPNVYDVTPVFEDVLRVVGAQEANLGPASGDGTATESAIAESSRMSALSASVDELDDVLTEIARASAQVLLAEVSAESITEIVGPGALWPQMTRAQIAKEITVTVEAGSTGRPNKAVKINEFKAIAPFLMQTPGVRPDKVTGYMIRLIDDTLDVADWMDASLPSITAMNSAPSAGPAAGTPEDPAAQGVGPGQGAQAPQGGAPPAEEGPEGGNVPNLPAFEAHGMARRFAGSA